MCNVGARALARVTGEPHYTNLMQRQADFLGFINVGGWATVPCGAGEFDVETFVPVPVDGAQIMDFVNFASSFNVLENIYAVGSAPWSLSEARHYSYQKAHIGDTQ